MLFNSFNFGLFLTIVYVIYWAIGSSKLKLQNVLLLGASYFFYGVWDARFLVLLFLSSYLDYFLALQITKTQLLKQKKVLLYCSVLWNLGVLFVFKYYNFFVDNFIQLFQINSESSIILWNLILPVGLSFYTFQTLGYTLDVYNNTTKPTKNLLSFLCFISFFPQLVAGPIEKAKNMLPQFNKERIFNTALQKEGLRQILWGLFKKIIVAEKLAVGVDLVFNNPNDYHFLSILYGGLLFLFQIYCDFSGYTDIALGTAKLFGFKLSINFKTPFLAKSTTSFWKSWHITLTQWFINQVYYPLTKKNKINKPIAIVITFTLIGFWHGASWNFILFGFLSALLILLERIKWRQNTINSHLETRLKYISTFYMIGLFAFLGLIFRAQENQQLYSLLFNIFLFKTEGLFNSLIGINVLFLLFVLVFEGYFKNKDFPLQSLETWMPKPIRWIFYYLLIFIIINYAEERQAFIYFQF